MEGRIFVCHASADAGFAQRAASALERAGLSCWIAPRDIAPGENYTQAILDALAVAPALVLVFSGSTNESPHVQRELETAVGTGTRIIPVRLESVEPAPSLRYFIGSAQWLDIVRLSPGQWEPMLVESARRALGSASPPTASFAASFAAPFAAPGVAPPRRRSRKALLLTSSAVLVLAAIGATWLLVLDDGDSGNGTTAESPVASSPSATEPSTAPAGPSTSAPPSAATSPATSPATGAATGAVTGTPVIEEDFESGTAFPIGTYQSNTGTMVSSLLPGALRVSVANISDGWDSWVSVDTPSPLAAWTVGSTFVSARSDGACGVMASDGLSVVTADLDRGSATARISVYGNQRVLAQKNFNAASVTGRLSVSLESGVLVMRAGDVTVASMPWHQLGPITEGGVVGVGDTNDCDFDDFAILSRP